MPLTHIDAEGAITMVDVADKAVTSRSARARGRITMSAEAYQAILQGRAAKGNVLATARALPALAGVDHRVLFSTRCFKQSGARLSEAA